MAFDVTPHRYITGIITEKGVFRPGGIKNIMKKTRKGTRGGTFVPPVNR
jgi:methylthioribose-1-phosphate isomerase